ncbi:MAG: oligosaccharide flippase family protein [Planctomycetes bacterium]|nr:oligosaccharide flippase family protein [Planctomycetota bacterium]
MESGGPSKNIREFKTRSIVFFAIDFVVRGLGVLLFLYAARVFDKDGFGDLNYVARFVGVATTVGDFGIGTLILKRVGGFLDRSRFRLEIVRYFWFRTAIALLIFGASASYFVFEEFSYEVRLTAILGLVAMVVRVLPEIISGAARAVGSGRIDASIRILQGTANVLVAIALLSQDFGIASFGYAWLASAFVATITAVYVRKSVNEKFGSGTAVPAVEIHGQDARATHDADVPPVEQIQTVETTTSPAVASTAETHGQDARATVPAPPPGERIYSYRDVFRNAMPFAVLTVCVIIYFHIDTLMLYNMVSEGEAGIYSAAYRFVEAMLLVPAASAAAIIPLLSAVFARKDFAEGAKLAENAIRILIYLGVFFAGALFFLGDEILAMLLGEGYAASEASLRILAFTIPIVYASSITSSIIASSDFARINTYLAIFMAIANVTANYFVIPLYEAAGASATTLATEGTGLVLGYIFISARICRIEVFRALLGCGIAFLAATASAYALDGLAGKIVAIAVLLAVISGFEWTSRRIGIQNMQFGL